LVFLNLNIMFPNFIYFPLNDIISFFLMAESYSTVYFFIYSFVDGQVGWFHNLTSVNWLS
jgi:hypothetical protein